MSDSNQYRINTHLPQEEWESLPLEEKYAFVRRFEDCIVISEGKHFINKDQGFLISSHMALVTEFDKYTCLVYFVYAIDRERSVNGCILTERKACFHKTCSVDEWNEQIVPDLQQAGYQPTWFNASTSQMFIHKSIEDSTLQTECDRLVLEQRSGLS